MFTDQELRERWAASLRAARDAAGLTQAALATRAGLTPQAVSRLELASGLPSDQTRQALAVALGMRVEELFAYPPVATDVQPSAAS